MNRNLLIIFKVYLFLLSSFGNQQILALSEIDSVATVYNFEVENTHTYVVGNAQLYVHNTCVVTNELLSSGKLHPDDVAAFTADFGGNNFLLNKFASGEFSVDAWKALSSNPLMKTNVNWLGRTSKRIDEGGELVTDNAKIILNKNGKEVLTIENGKILPSTGSYDFPIDGSAIAVGEEANGYQVFKKGNGDLI